MFLFANQNTQLINPALFTVNLDSMISFFRFSAVGNEQDPMVAVAAASQSAAAAAAAQRVTPTKPAAPSMMLTPTVAPVQLSKDQSITLRAQVQAYRYIVRNLPVPGNLLNILFPPKASPVAPHQPKEVGSVEAKPAGG